VNGNFKAPTGCPIAPSKRRAISACPGRPARVGVCGDFGYCRAAGRVALGARPAARHPGCRERRRRITGPEDVGVAGAVVRAVTRPRGAAPGLTATAARNRRPERRFARALARLLRTRGAHAGRVAVTESHPGGGPGSSDGRYSPPLSTEK